MNSRVTIKQLEALYWVATLGSFEKAALHLNATQSAVSKRIKELEALSGIHVFDRSQRSARLTAGGEHLLTITQDMLGLTDRIGKLREGQGAPYRRLRIGVTEHTAVTWLPRLISVANQRWQSVLIEPEVHLSHTLYERLLDQTLDMIVVPDAFSSPETTSVPLGEVHNGWLAKPGFVKEAGPLTLGELANYRIFVQGGRFGVGVYLSKWLKNDATAFRKVIACNSLSTLLGIAVAGEGICHLPTKCFAPLIDRGLLEVIPVLREFPPIMNVVMYRQHTAPQIVPEMAQLAKEVCDFGTTYFAQAISQG